MALLGEEVADAYISVHADTAAFRRDMRKLQASTTALFKAIGTQAGEQFRKAVNKEFRGISLANLGPKVAAQMRRLGGVVQGALSKSLAKVNEVFTRLIADPIRDVVDRVGQGFGRVVRQMSNDLKILGGGFNLYITDPLKEIAGVVGGQLSNQMTRVRVLVDQVSDSMRGFGRETRDTFIAMGDLLHPDGWEGLASTVRRKVADIRDSLQLMSVHFRASAARSVEEFRDGFTRLWNSRVVSAAREAGSDLGDAVGSGMTVGFRKLSEAFESLGSIVKKGLGGTKKATKDATEAFEEFAETAGDFGDGVEKSFGKADRSRGLFIGRLKGSRNDFLNIVGVMGGAIEKFATRVVDKGLDLVGKAFEGLGESLIGLGGKDGKGGPLAGIGQSLSGLGESIGGMAGKGGWVGLAVAAAGFTLALTLMFPALAMVTTLMSGLLGIVISLTASLAFASAGVLLPLGAAALAAAAGIGALVVAFSDMSDEQKKAFEPLKDAFKTMQKAVQDRLFVNLTEQMKGMSDILTNLISPLLQGAATALSGVIDYMIEAFKRPEIQQTFATLGETLPGILTSMGQGLTDLVLGLIGFFAAISPYAAQIAEKIADLVRDFADWANSAEGRETISKFFEKAWDSALILWGAIKEVGRALGTLFEEGKEGGDSMIAKIGEIIGKFAEWASSEEGRRKIKQWFQDAKDLARDLSEVIGTVGDMIKELDTPENRAALRSLIGFLGDILEIVSKVSAVFGSLPGLIEGIKRYSFVIPGLSGVLNLIDDIVAGIKWISNHLPGAKAASGGGGAGMKAGGILNSPRTILAGEAGREMVVPLVRPLSQVDPSVRAVSAFARGLDPSAFGNNTNPGGKVVNISDGAIRVQVPTEDPEQAANAVLDRLVARWK